MSPISELTELLSKLPGLGPRQARRVVQYLLSRDQAFRKSLSRMIDGMSEATQQCARCSRYDDPSRSRLCRICSDDSRDASLLMVVEHDVDIEAVEASLTYRGYYFVLGGLLNLVKQRKDKVVRSKEFFARIDEKVKEVILALSTTPEGDFTARELMKELETKKLAVKVSMLGRGLSVGAELEYADPETLRSALKYRS